MSKNKRRLGKGLEYVMSQNPPSNLPNLQNRNNSFTPEKKPNPFLDNLSEQMAQVDDLLRANVPLDGGNNQSIIDIEDGLEDDITEDTHFSEKEAPVENKEMIVDGSKGTLGIFDGEKEEELKPVSADFDTTDFLEFDKQDIMNISISLVDSNPWQPRQYFDSKDIQELSHSLRDHGLLQPIIVRKNGDRYELIAGERRFQAAMKLDWKQIPAVVREATDREMAELAIIENIERKDLNPIEKALSFQSYIQQHKCSQEEFARRLNLDRSTVSNFLRLLDLPVEVQKRIIEEKLTQGHARALLPLMVTKDQMSMIDRIIDEKMSVRDVENVVSQWNERDRSVEVGVPEKTIRDVPPKKKPEKQRKTPQILDLERQLQEALSLKVNLVADNSQKGKLEIFFRNNEEFESLMDYFRQI